MKKDPQIRFWRKVKKTDSCWLWIGALNPNGYGVFYSVIRIYAHRYSYELHKEKIPEGMVVDHLCRVRNCVNPDHLEAVTFKENILRGIGTAAVHARKTHCKNGHEFNEENTAFRMRGDNHYRWCKVCDKERHRKAKLESYDLFLKQ